MGRKTGPGLFIYQHFIFIHFLDVTLRIRQGLRMHRKVWFMNLIQHLIVFGTFAFLKICVDGIE